MKAREIMRTAPFTIASTDTLGNAQRTMARARIRHLPVLLDGRIAGILSERDVLAERARADGDELWWKIPVSRAMRTPAQTAGPDDSLSEIVGRMAMAKIGALPIVELGRLLGIVTVTDVLNAELREAMSPTPPSEVTVADAMTALPCTILPDARLVEAVSLMLDHHVRHLPVVDASATLVGMLSERDVRTAIGDPLLYAESRPRTAAQYLVRDLMTRPATSVPFDRSLIEVGRMFADERVGAVTVTDRFGALIGILSYVDVLRLLAG